MYYILAFSLGIYFLTLCLFIIGLFIQNPKKTIHENITNVSVIICVKDGEKSVFNIISDLKKQLYKYNIEFIIVDDLSTDSTKEIILDNIKDDLRFKYISSEFGDRQLSHKKRAIDAGIKNSRYDYLLFTDVDCRFNDRWIESMMKNYQYDNDYIIGCSIINKANTTSSFFQQLDYYMLMIASLASCNLGFSLACTGQNQSYKKSLYNSINGFSKIKQLLQGDDSIFLQLLKSRKSLKVSFSLDANSYVKSKTHHKWKDLLLQRMRWSGDARLMWKYNKFFYVIILSTFLSNLFFIIIPIIFFEYINFILLILFLKFLLELTLYFIGIKKINQKLNLIQFCYWFIVQIPYVVLMGILSFFTPLINWKGRSST